MFSSARFLNNRHIPAVPAGVGLYVVGDIHGRADCLEMVFDKIDNDPRRVGFDSCLEIYLGDYVDRGTDSCRVLSMLIERAGLKSTVTLRGNHETMLLAALDGDDRLCDWSIVGGLETMSSYGVKLSSPLSDDNSPRIRQEWSQNMPIEHKDFLKNLVHRHEVGDYLFVHAGVRPGVPLSEQLERDLLWIRDDFLESSAWHGKMIVHGHTPVESPEFLPNRINIDTGAYITGNLTCLCLHGENQNLL